MPRPIRSMLVLSALAILFAGSPAFAAPPDADRIKQLEQENDALRQELAQLRLQVSQLKRELEKHQAGADIENADSSGEKEKPSEPDADETDDKKDKRKPRTFRSADEIYRSIPQDMRPARDGWDIVERRTVGEWLKTNITGKQFEARKKISHVDIRYDTTNRLWDVHLYFEYEEMRYMNWDMEERLYRVTLRGDKDFADKARKKYKAGGTVHVSGTIRSISWDSAIIQAADKNWHPTMCTLALDAPQVK